MLEIEKRNEYTKKNFISFFNILHEFKINTYISYFFNEITLKTIFLQDIYLRFKIKKIYVKHHYPT